MIENLKTAGHNLKIGGLLTAVFFAMGHMRMPEAAIHTYFSFFEGLLNNKRIEEIQ